MKAVFCKRFRSRKNGLIVLVIVVSLSIVLWTSQSDATQVLNGLCISVIASVLCWFLVEERPSCRLRSAYKQYLSSTYKQTKRNIAGIIIRHAGLNHLSPEQKQHLQDELEDPIRFREYFKDTTETGLWYESVGNWTAATINDIDFHLSELARAIESTLDNCPWVDVDSTFTLRQLCHRIRMHQSLSDFNANPVKYESEYLVWPLMANFSLITGHRVEDPIQKAINQL